MQQQVAEFMRDVKGLTLPDKPIDDGPGELCRALILEETDETCDAMYACDQWGNKTDALVELADGLADLLYVVLYTANAYGIDIEPIFNEVHRSNMTKLNAPKRNDGKQLKGENYQPPNLEPLIKAQMGT